MEEINKILRDGLLVLADGFNKKDFSWPENIEEKLLAYVALLQKWNRAYNLTSITNTKEILVRHIFDSLAIIPYVCGQRVLDVGSGAGLPGIPLALAFPGKEFVLLDSNSKKTHFLVQAKLALSIGSVKIAQKRVESFFCEEKFNVIVSRAVGSVADLIAKSKHLLTEDGCWLFMKGREPQKEIAALSGFDASIFPLQVPFLGEGRSLIVVKDKL